MHRSILASVTLLFLVAAAAPPARAGEDCPSAVLTVTPVPPTSRDHLDLMVRGASHTTCVPELTTSPAANTVARVTMNTLMT